MNPDMAPPATATTTAVAGDKVPILLLKTKSTPGDGYEDIFSQPQSGDGADPSFDPSFVPVLEHKFQDGGMAKVESILSSNMIGTHQEASYGGLIFTSQRAVEAFAKIVQDGQSESLMHICIAASFCYSQYVSRQRKAVAILAAFASV